MLLAARIRAKMAECGDQPSISVAEYGGTKRPVKAGLRPRLRRLTALTGRFAPPRLPPSDRRQGAADYQQGACQLFPLRHLCTDSDSHSQAKNCNAASNGFSVLPARNANLTSASSRQSK